MSLIKTYVGTDGKLHSVDATGANPVIPFKSTFTVSGTIYISNNSQGGAIYSYSNGNFVIPKNTKITVSGGSWSFNESAISSGYQTTTDGTLSYSFSTGTGITPRASISYTFEFD